jgi:hypothetical protein
VEPEVAHITDEEEEEPMEEEAFSVAASDGPVSTPVAAPIPQVDAPVPAATPPPASQAASAPTPVPSPAASEEPEEIGWTTRNKFKEAPEDAHYHNLLTTMLAEYYPEFAASVKYYCAEHTHPVEATYWKTNVIITAWNNTDQSQNVVTTHSPRARRASAYDSMEDAAQAAYLHYHGRRFEDMQDDRYRYLPRYDSREKTWAVLAPPASDPTLDTTVRHLSAMQEVNEALREELRAAQKSEKRLQNQIDEMAVQLGQPTIYKKKARVFTMVDRAP